MSANDLSPKQLLFIEEYLIDLNATQAAIRVGYARNSANREGARLMSNAVISALVDERINERAASIRVDASWVLERLINNADRAAVAHPVTDREGNVTGEYVYDGGVVNRSLELIGKHIGMFTDKLQLSGSVETTKDLRSMTPDELAAYRAKLLASIGGGRAGDSAEGTGEGRSGDDSAGPVADPAIVPRND